MRLAARFPIKPYPPLIFVSLVLQLAIVLLGFIYLPSGWRPWLVALVCIITSYLSWYQYRQITSAPDDLCWTGENWLIRFKNPLPRQEYLHLLGQSWVSSFACILHFRAQQQIYVWLFTRSAIGERAFSELRYLVELERRRASKSGSAARSPKGQWPRDWLSRVWKR